MDALFTAFTVDTLSGNISGVLLVGVTITLSFLGYRYLMKASNKL